MAEQNDFERALRYEERAQQTRWLGPSRSAPPRHPPIGIVLRQLEAQQERPSRRPPTDFPGVELPERSERPSEPDSEGQYSTPEGPIEDLTVPAPEEMAPLEDENSDGLKEEIRGLRETVVDLRDDVLDLKERGLQSPSAPASPGIPINKTDEAASPFTRRDSPISPDDFGLAPYGSEGRISSLTSPQGENNMDAATLRARRKARLEGRPRQADEIGAETFDAAVGGSEYNVGDYKGKYVPPSSSLGKVTDPMSDTIHAPKTPADLQAPGELKKLPTTYTAMFRAASVGDLALDLTAQETDNPAWVVYDQEDPILSIRLEAYNTLATKRGRQKIAHEQFANEKFGRAIGTTARDKGLDALGSAYGAIYVTASERSEMKRAKLGSTEVEVMAERKAAELETGRQAVFGRALRLAIEKSTKNLMTEDSPLKTALTNVFSQHFAAQGLPPHGVRSLVERAYLAGAEPHFEAVLKEAARLSTMGESAFLEYEAAVRDTPVAAPMSAEEVEAYHNAERSAALRGRLVQGSQIPMAVLPSNGAGIGNQSSYEGMLPQPKGLRFAQELASRRA